MRHLQPRGVIVRNRALEAESGVSRGGRGEDQGETAA
jgi:hypothetical protein